MKISWLFMVYCLSLSISCSKSGSEAGKQVEIYRLANPRGPGPCKIDVTRATLADTPFITNNKIRSYNKKEFEFLLTDEAGKRINSLLDNEALAITVDKEIIYYFVYKPIYSSSVCNDQISMYYSQNKMGMYIMNSNPSSPVADLRNDSRLMSALSAQGKLKK